MTRFELEATDLGYRVDGVLGYASALGATHGAGPETIHWASRAGRGRRYEESLPALDAPRGAMPASVDDEDEYAVGPVALLQPGSAAGLATLGVRPGGRVVHGGGAPRAIAMVADGADAALSAIGFQAVLALAAADEWTLSWMPPASSSTRSPTRPRTGYEEVLPLPPDALLTAPGEIRSFADVSPYRRRRGDMLRAAGSET